MSQIPPYARAVLSALRFAGPCAQPLASLPESGWRKALSFCDRAHLTLPLGLVCRDSLPEPVRLRIDRNLAANAERWLRIRSAYREIAAALASEGLSFVVLKGFSHCPDFVEDPRYRAQYDLDLLLPRERLQQARDVASSLGYEPIGGRDRLPIDHLPAMIRKTGWEWRGDFFDVEIPTSLEFHFRLWDSGTERFGPRRLDEFWDRRRERRVDGVRFVGLHPVDAAGYASLHLLRHLLRGSLRPSHVYELAWLLDRKSDDAQFWNLWREWHDPSLRRLEAVCFALAGRWFDCRLPPAAVEEIVPLPPGVARWLALAHSAPLAGMFRPNKDELWLHWHLLDSMAARADVLRRRLLPVQLPGPVDAVHLPDERITARIRLRRRRRYLLYVTSRVFHHLRALPALAGSAMRWFHIAAGLDRSYWLFLSAAGLYAFGLFIFFLLYNLYLLQIGFKEDFLGLVASLMTAGGVAGSIPAAFAIQRYGLRNTILVCFALAAGISALRACATHGLPLLVLAFLGGMATSAWAVAISPGVAQLTNEDNRPLGFGLVFSSGIAIGVLGGLAGGALPGFLSRLHAVAAGVHAYRFSLLAGCAIVLLALWPLSRISLGVPPAPKRKLYRPNPMVTRFLIAIAVWSFGTGAFNPFFNAFFARRHVPVEQIGFIFSAAQFTQVAAVLLAPLIFRKFGLTRGVSGMQLGTALALIALGAAAGPLWTGLAYTAYMVSQYMTEPGLYTFLMDAVPVGERSGVSALNVLVVSCAQAIAAACAGAALERLGYMPVVLTAALICVVAALLFRTLLGARKPLGQSHSQCALDT